MIKICVSGSKGKKGSRVLELAKDDSEIEIAGQFDIDDDPAPLIEGCDCLIEFTTPKATVEHLVLCEKHKKAIVIGTTGLSDGEKEAIEKASRKIPIVCSPNMSVGVNLLFRMAYDAAKVFGAEYDVSIVEAHHVHKKDAPSGTAKELAHIVEKARAQKAIPIESIREDEIVGEQTTTFDSPFDTVEITHSAKTRDIFAKGALKAAKWVAAKPTGLYTMKDVLNI